MKELIKNWNLRAHSCQERGRCEAAVAVKECADELSALLNQHAVAPDARAGLYKQVPTSCMCGGNMAWVRIRESGAEEMVGCICHTFAHAAEQPKFRVTEEQVRLAAETFKQDYFGMAQALSAIARPEQPKLTEAAVLLCDSVQKFLNEEGGPDNTTNRVALRISLVRMRRELTLLTSPAAPPPLEKEEK